MATTELTIRQLADEGGTTPIAPVTVIDAVLKGDGTTLTEELTALNNGLRDYVIITQRTSAEITINANDRCVFTVNISKDGYTPIGIVGIALSNNWMYVGGFSVNASNNTAQVIIHNGINRVQANQTVYLTVLYKLTNV